MDWLPPATSRSPDSGMGHFHVSVQVSHRDGGRFEPLEALVDTGATYTWIPREVLDSLGVVPEEEWPFVLANGREVRYPVAWINIRMRERVQPTIVVFGEPGSEPILGVVTLEEFRLAADPVNRRLISVPGRLKALTGHRLTPTLTTASAGSVTWRTRDERVRGGGDEVMKGALVLIPTHSRRNRFCADEAVPAARRAAASRG